MHGEMIDYYRDWLFGIIDRDGMAAEHWSLLIWLSGKEFVWSRRHDRCRAEDGLALREDFLAAWGDPYGDVRFSGLSEECSVLEMMIALAMRIEDILFEPDEGDRTATWFWSMIDCMGLGGMDVADFDPVRCGEIVDRMLERRYERDGRGGLFRTENPDIDMRKTEIWYQMNVWIEENF